MLPKKRRLNAHEVRRVLAAGRGVKGGVVSLKYVVNKGHFRAAAVVPKSTARQATKRNHARRTLYTILASLSPTQSKVFDNMMGVFFIRSLPTPLAPAMREDIASIIKKLSSYV